MRARAGIAAVVSALACGACGAWAGPSAEAPAPSGVADDPVAGRLPAIPAAVGEGPALEVVYPAEGATITTDSTFVFGAVRLTDPTLRINGASVDVEPNGAFLAFLPVPEDGVYRLEARGSGSAAELERLVNGAGLEPAEPAPEPGAGADSVRAPPLAIAFPTDGAVVTRGEVITVRASGPEGVFPVLRMPYGWIPMRPARRALGSAGFMQASAGAVLMEYSADVRIDAPVAGGQGSAASGLLPPPGTLRNRGVPDAEAVDVATILAPGDTAVQPLPRVDVLPAGFAIPALVRTERPDSAAIGRATLPPGTPFHWFLPNGTAALITGARDGLARVRLASDLSIWVPQVDLEATAGLAPLPGAGRAAGDAYSVRALPAAGWVDVRVSLSERLPFRVDARDGGLDITVYGARTRTNWAYQGGDDPEVRRVWWEQAGDERYVVHVETASTPWGWASRWEDEATLVVRVRRPPAIDPNAPLSGLRIGVDAGHADDTGAPGPTGLREGDANRRVAKRLVEKLRRAGARVLEIRPDADNVGLGARPLMAVDSSVHVLISVHNNAFPDGVNPFERAGTSVLYNTWQSLDLARALQRELVDELGLRDLGPIWGDLALARPTWMPSVLTETMFLMVPAQEAALRDPEVQGRIAEAHVRGLEAFLRERAVARP
ncbi:MAG: N-acetylmuramoyl-L-alanine amidase [Gemmatimonadota bacterium]